MKKITILLLFAFGITRAQTTTDEFNYMSKGYEIAVSSGMDIKKGYVVKDLTVYNSDSYTFDYKLFLRESNNSLAGVILKATSKTWSNVYYLAIPINNQELLTYFNTRLELWDESMVTAYSKSSTFLNSELIKFYNPSK
ncbi:hypothetical protein [Flavobacterium sp. TSSA_36]|uniref:hypothetical protein n=1 Tax=Flavobacterium sp. TSSA_36 TaxID=3447669 RepID=UPI003F35E4AE